MKVVNLKLSGALLLTSNVRLANKMDEIAREMSTITSKRKKTDEDLIELARLEFIGGLYLTEGGQVGFPSWNVFRSLQDGAKINKLGKAVERAIVPISADIVPIKHTGPSDPEEMWLKGCYDQRSVKVGTSTVTRTRPLFTDWSLDVTLNIDTSILNMDDFNMIVRNAGEMVGIGDYRPRFGRFTAEVS